MAGTAFGWSVGFAIFFFIAMVVLWVLAGIWWKWSNKKYKNEPKYNQWLGFLIGAIAATVLFIIALIAVFLTMGKKSDDVTAPSDSY